MILNTTKGIYKLEINYRDAFNQETFQEKYLEECYDKYQYIVGDISSNILRLKGFDDVKDENGRFKNIDKYIEDSCAFGCPYFVLSRIHSEKEMNNDNSNPITTDERFDITPIKKENFDKESLILKTSAKTKPNIVIDSNKLNQIPIGSLPEDLVEIAQLEKNSNQNQRKANNNNNKPKEPEPEQTFVSASPDFDPSKKEKNKKRNNNNRKNNNNNRRG